LVLSIRILNLLPFKPEFVELLPTCKMKDPYTAGLGT
jgi:hypothetical protein